jgi:hypothetical protein
MTTRSIRQTFAVVTALALVFGGLHPSFVAVARAQGLSGTSVDCVLQGKAPVIKVCFNFPVAGEVDVRFWHEPTPGRPGGLYRMHMKPAGADNCYSAVVPPPSTSTGVAQYSFQATQPGQTLRTGQSITPKVVNSATACNGKVAETSSDIPECGPGLACDQVHLEPFSGVQHIDPASNPPLGQSLDPASPGPNAAAPPAPVPPVAPASAPAAKSAGKGGGAGGAALAILGIGAAAAGVAVAAKAAAGAADTGGGGDGCYSYNEICPDGHNGSAFISANCTCKGAHDLGIVTAGSAAARNGGAVGSRFCNCYP